MKTRLTHFFTALSCLFLSYQATAQWTQHSFQFDNVTRNYWLYVPPMYNVSNPASVVVTLHGMGDNASNFRNIGFNLVADTANILILVPDALTDALTSMTAWNSGAGTMGYYPNSTVNDKGFINAMVDSTVSNYAVNEHQVYICGFSMGGFMTQKMALQASNKFAAFASAAGTVGSGTPAVFPGRALPIAHFHGTKDATVGYNNNMYGINVDSLVNFWVDNNNCNTTPTTTILPDTQADNYVVTHYLYSGGDNGSEVELFKVDSAGHEWLTPMNDIFYTVEMWKFFRKHSHQSLSIEKLKAGDLFEVYPNPAKNELFVEMNEAFNENATISITDIHGNLVVSMTNLSNDIIQIPTQDFANGIYFLTVQTKKSSYTKKWILDK